MRPPVHPRGRGWSPDWGDPARERRGAAPKPHHGAWLGQAGAPGCPRMPANAEGMHREMRLVTGREKIAVISLPAQPPVLVIDGRFGYPAHPLPVTAGGS